MITHPLPPVEAQPIHSPRELSPLPEQFSLHPTPQDTKDIKARTINVTQAFLQILVGYEWLLSGGDKLLLGTFPAQLSGLLNASLSGGHLVGFFAVILRELVLPNAAFFGYLIEWGETLAGLGLMTAGLVILLRPLAGRFLRGRNATLFEFGDRLLEGLAPVAAIGAGLLGLSFFFLDGLPLPWFVPTIAYGGAIDTGLFLAGASLILVISQFMQRSSFYLFSRMSPDKGIDKTSDVVG